MRVGSREMVFSFNVKGKKTWTDLLILIAKIYSVYTLVQISN